MRITKVWFEGVQLNVEGRQAQVHEGFEFCIDNGLLWEKQDQVILAFPLTCIRRIEAVEPAPKAVEPPKPVAAPVPIKKRGRPKKA